MKKFLAGTTALVAATVVAGQAKAADPIELSLGGFLNAYVSYADIDEVDGSAENYADVLVHTDTEVYFRGSTKLDNGLTVAVNIDMEADRGNAGDNDDVFLSISSDTLGKVELGATKTPVYDMSVGAPSAGVGLSDSDAEFAVGEGYYGVDDMDRRVTTASDGHKVTYFSPNVAGFQVGASYGLEPTGVNGSEVNKNASGSIYSYGASIAYGGEFSGVSIEASAGIHQEFNPTAANEESQLYGLSVGVAGFEVGAGWTEIENYSSTEDRDVESYAVGVAYSTGPYSVSFGYFGWEDDLGTVAETDDDELNQYVLGFGYDLGAGVEVSAGIFTGENEGGSTATTKREAWGAMAGLAVSF